jgi:hypothetical protein
VVVSRETATHQQFLGSVDIQYFMVGGC